MPPWTARAPRASSCRIEIPADSPLPLWNVSSHPWFSLSYLKLQILWWWRHIPRSHTDIPRMSTSHPRPKASRIEMGWASSRIVMGWHLLVLIIHHVRISIAVSSTIIRILVVPALTNVLQVRGIEVPLPFSNSKILKPVAQPVHYL